MHRGAQHHYKLLQVIFTGMYKVQAFAWGESERQLLSVLVVCFILDILCTMYTDRDNKMLLCVGLSTNLRLKNCYGICLGPQCKHILTLNSQGDCS